MVVPITLKAQLCCSSKIAVTDAANSLMWPQSAAGCREREVKKQASADFLGILGFWEDVV
ncbi:hypothetical protein ONR75_26535 [Rhodopseudomonas sp. P2A-2r]|uniref:hypothetical protein n=1 Tax=Rhodopseudomonas sp. P2A-2r TaxID=2991972 RepID=UPI0022342494|nr:hypothetical protein [Rhodopseudomonas sp. P2A-2r]UZE48330.1 hypothetical protein ONR75_26535 [Rhodopseudomonas sp. P2A-2r]